MLTPVLAALAFGACAGDMGPTDGIDAIDTTSDGAQPQQVAGDIVVFAASSLTEAFTEIAEQFSAEHPDAELVLNFAASNDLVGQIDEGAPADVFVSADDANMGKLVADGMNATDPVVIARNSLAIIVEEGNPRGITALADLAAGGLVVVLCAVEAPCGQGAARALENAGVSVTPRSYELSAKSVVTKVTGGEADAGIVFVTDVNAAADTTDGVTIDAEVNVISNYPIAVTRNAHNTAGAQAFIDFALGATGQAILAEYGFLAP